MYDAAIINYNSSNLFSVKSACENVGLKTIITNEHSEILNSKSIILPGVGSFNSAIKKLSDMKLDKIIYKFYENQKPILGICLGMQLLFDESVEFYSTKGLSLLKGKVIKLESNIDNFYNYKIPHIGWSNLIINNKIKNSLLEGIQKNTYMYFVHSYKIDVFDHQIVSSTVNYGKNIINASIEYKNIFATQFHPEKSGHEGLKIYNNFKKKIYESNL